MKICVTGGAGFIGSETVRQLANSTYEITVIDSLTYAGNLGSLSQVRNQINFLEFDIRDSAKLKNVFNETRFDAVVNFAAETHVDNSISSPEIFLETNILGAFNLLELARKHEFKFLQVSTDEVYGSIRDGEFVESDKLNPSSPYSASKASAELLMQAYIKTYDIAALGVRCSNNYGHYQHFEKLIPAFIGRIINKSKVPVYGDGSNVREWIHVSDSVIGILKVLELGQVGQFYNISSGDFHSNLEVARRIIEHFGGGDDSIEFVKDRPGHDFRYAISSSKIRSELGWEPKVDFANGLSRTIKWYEDNPEYLSGRK